MQALSHVSMMHVHLFGAYFGLAVSSRFSEPSPRSEKNASTPRSDLLSMLGEAFGLMFQLGKEIAVRAGGKHNSRLTVPSLNLVLFGACMDVLVRDWRTEVMTCISVVLTVPIWGWNAVCYIKVLYSDMKMESLRSPVSGKIKMHRRVGNRTQTGVWERVWVVIGSTYGSSIFFLKQPCSFCISVTSAV